MKPMKIAIVGACIGLAAALTACAAPAQAADTYFKVDNKHASEFGLEDIQFAPDVSGELYLYKDLDAKSGGNSVEASVYYQATKNVQLDVGVISDSTTNSNDYRLGSEVTLMDRSETSPVFLSFEADLLSQDRKDEYGMFGVNLEYDVMPSVTLTAEVDKYFDISFKNRSKAESEFGVEYHVLPMTLIDAEYGYANDDKGYAELKVTQLVGDFYVKPFIKRSFEAEDTTYAAEVGYNF